MKKRHPSTNLFLPFLLLLSLVFLTNLPNTLANNNIISISDSLILEIATAKNDKDKANAFINLSEYYINKDNQRGIFYAKKGMLLAHKEGLQEEEIRSKLTLSRFYIDKGDFLKSNDQIQMAQEMNILLGDSLLDAAIHYTKALLFYHLDEHDKASDICYQALRIYDQKEDLPGQSKILNLIAAIYSTQNKFDKALQYSLRSLAIKKNLHDSISIAGDLSNIASSHMQQGHYHKAEEYLHEAVKLNLKYDQKNWLAINYQQLASCYQKQSKYIQAEQYIFQALQLYEELNNKYNVVGIKLLLAKNHFDQKEYIEAKSIYQSVLRTGQKNKYLSETASANHGLYKIAKLEKDYKAALDYFSAYQINHDSLVERKGQNRLASLEIQYAMEQKHNELEFEKQKNNSATQEKNLYMIILSISLLATVIVALLSILRFRIKIRYSKIKEQKLEDELEYKNKELTTNVMSLMKKNEMLSEITDKLIEVESKAVKEETKSALKRIAVEIEKSTKDKIWEEFEMRFKQVHSEFYETLIHQFPDLSPNEQRLCAFLRLNLSSKEIAAITGKNTRSIEMGRFRLRKKLGISSQDVNLISFISKI